MVKAVVLVAVLIGGCSFATMRSPRGTPPECTESTVAPIVDIAVALASPFVAYSILKSNDTSESSNADDAGIRNFFRGFAAVAVSFPVWGVAGTSSIFGFIRAGQCSRAKSGYQQLMAAPPGPGPYAPPPRAPGPYAPGPYAPGPYAPGPYAPGPYAPAPMPAAPPGPPPGPPPAQPQ